MAAALPDAASRTDADVLIVGYGPVGQVLSILLAQRGWRVSVVERWPQPYPMPRAVAFDSEAARIFAAAGVGGHINEFGEPSGEYTWKNAAGDILLHIEASEHGWCGWPDSTSMYQPGLERALERRGAELPTLQVLRGFEAVQLSEHDQHVELHAKGRGGTDRVLTARWVVGCDGANSFVRDYVGTTVTDFSFAYDWLICDVVLHEPRKFQPNNLQICDPARPRTEVSAGPGHRRWEFMRLEGEPLEEFNRIETAWRLLSLVGVTPENATLERHAVYTFQARLADRWRSGRMLLAGDAVHLMPPFAAQGMCSGIRDAANLAWKLDLVLRGQADERLLDTYAEERRAHVQHAIKMSVDLGKVICQTDPVAAADRDAVMIAARERGLSKGQPRAGIQPLSGGLLRRDATGARPLPPAGQLTPQHRAARGARVGLFDEVVGTGFVLMATEDPRDLLDAEALAFLDGIGTRLVHIFPASAADRASDIGVVDLDGAYLPYLAEAGVLGILVRPDFYVFGGAADRADLCRLVEDLRHQLAAPVPAAGR